MRRIVIAAVAVSALITLAGASSGHFFKRADVAPAVGSPPQQTASSKESSYRRASKSSDENAFRFMEAVIEGDTGKVRELLARGVDVNTKMEISDWVALSSAASSGHTEIVRMLLDAGADVNTGGGAALTTAAGSGHAEIVRLLLERGADVKAKRSDGLTALMLAAGGGQHDIARLLIERGAEVNAKMRGNGLTPLHFAARDARNPETFKVLLESGADTKERDSSGETALIVAAREGNLNAVQTLIAAGVDVHDKSVRDNSTALIVATAFNGKDSRPRIAKSKNHLAVIKALIAAGADVNAKQKGDYTALMFAAQEGDDETAQLLLKAGADPYVKNNKGETAVTLAKRNGKLRMFQ